MSKGSNRRPMTCTDEELADRWAMAFDAQMAEAHEIAVPKDELELAETCLRWKDLPVVITDWEFYPPGGVLNDPWPIRVKIAGELENGDFFHTWVEQEEVTRHDHYTGFRG